VLYTSGSTGRPKGVEIEHGALTNFLLSMAETPGLEAEDVLLAVTTISFDIAGLELFLPLTVGARVEIASRSTALDAVALGKALESSGATVMQATPATWRMLLESGWAGDERRKVLCGGEALGRDFAQRLLPKCGELWNLYGPTETTIWSSAARIESAEAVTIGRPIANTRMYVLDRYGEPVPVGVVGELWIGGAGVARGYLKRPELTAERFVEDRFGGGRMYRTGDLARYLADGRLECLGRTDSQVKVRGYRIELGEIESVLGEHPGIAECAVVVREVNGDRRLVAYVVGEADAESCRAHLRGRLPEYMLPTTYVSLAGLPRTPNNKLDRKALPAPEGTGAEPGTEYVAPRTATERAVAEVFAEVLSRSDVGVREDFFEAGGHSLLATRVVSRLRQRLEVELPVRAVFEAPTAEALARHLDTLEWAAKVAFEEAETSAEDRERITL
jgi:acyl-coenzyme A synthetase/AMP-(fatty) acid ligase